MLLFSRSNWILWNSRVWKLSAGMLPTAVLKVEQPQAWKEDSLVLRPDCGSNYVLSQHLGLLCSLSLFANIHSCYYQFPALTSELPEGRNHIWVCSPLYPWHPAPPDLAHGEHRGTFLGKGTFFLEEEASLWGPGWTWPWMSTIPGDSSEGF